MKILVKAPFFVALLNLVFRLVYVTIGRYSTSVVVEKKVNWVFMVFRPEYAVASGALSALAILVSIGLIVYLFANKSKGIGINMISIVLNMLYIYLYIRWMSVQ